MEKNFAPIIEKIKSTQDIVILVHENPDGDAIGSALGMLKGLEKLSKNVECFVENVPYNCEFLFERPNKIKPFDAMNTSKVYDLCIAIDSGDEDRLGKAKPIFDNAKFTICLDHHLTNNGYARLNYVDSEASSSGEVVYTFMKEAEIEIDAEIATPLYAAIISDTGMFKHSNTTSKTFKIVSDLKEAGIDITEISRQMFFQSTVNRTEFLGKVLQGLEMYINNKVCIIEATQKDIEKFSIDQSELDGMVEYARNIKGVEVGIFIKPYENLYKVSLRSNGKINVAEIAERFGGGGHKFAAGCKFSDCKVEQAKGMLLEELNKVLS